jgi:hypothetical protein
MKSSSSNAAVWLIGMGVLALTGWWWPGILFVAALSSLVRGSFKGFVWLAAIGLLAEFDVWWPGILILIGVGLVSGGFGEWGDSRTAPPADNMVEDDRPPDLQTSTTITNPVPQTPMAARPSLAGLPENCPACGGPVSEETVEWQRRTFYCGFCGSVLSNPSASADF